MLFHGVAKETYSIQTFYCLWWGSPLAIGGSQMQRFSIDLARRPTFYLSDDVEIQLGRRIFSNFESEHNSMVQTQPLRNIGLYHLCHLLRFIEEKSKEGEVVGKLCLLNSQAQCAGWEGLM